jgi:nucleolar protein 15
MRAYFSQFGTVLRLRLARNKKTGASKHYAFLEFDSGDVADIVAKTMNNYLMFGHILKVRRVPDEQLHPELWKGAGKRFKVVPRARLQARQMAQPKGREYWREKVEKEEAKRKEKAAQLKELGYEFAMPEIRKVEDVPMKDVEESTVAAEAVDEEKPKAIEESAAVASNKVEKEILEAVETVLKDAKKPKKVSTADEEKVKVKKSKAKESKTKKAKTSAA